MKKYRVCLTRDATQSASIIVEAADEDAAEELAYEAESNGKLNWETNDNYYDSDPGNTDVEEAEDDEAVGPCVPQPSTAMLLLIRAAIFRAAAITLDEIANVDPYVFAIGNALAKGGY